MDESGSTPGPMGVGRPARSDAARLWDESGRLSSGDRAAIQARLVAAERRLGSPLFVLVVDGLRRDTVEELATRTFAARGLGGDARSNPVLLVVAVRDRAATVETGKGNAGIVPEVDARRITKSLAASLSGRALAHDLTRAIDALVASADATAARRRPSPASDDEPSSDRASAAGGEGGDSADAASPDGAGQDASASSSPAESKPRGRSRLPVAAAIGALFLLALALRRRRALTKSRDDKPPADPPDRKRPR